MSIEAMTWALRVPVGGNSKIVLLGLANHAHPDGSEAYPSLNTLAKYACCSRSTARRGVRALLSDGWISEDGTGPRGQAKYRLAVAGRRDEFPALGDANVTPQAGPAGVSDPTRRGVKSDPKGVSPVIPEPSIEPSKNQAADARAASETREAGVAVGSGIGWVVETLTPLIESGKLIDPRSDGSDSALLVAINSHGRDRVVIALDHIAAWAADGTLKISNLSRLLPTALARAAAGSATGGSASSGGEQWVDVERRLLAARSSSRNELDLLVASRDSDPVVAGLVVAGGWKAVDDLHVHEEGYERRQACAKLKRAWKAGEHLDAEHRVWQRILAVDAAVTRHCAATGNARHEMGYRTPPITVGTAAA